LSTFHHSTLLHSLGNNSYYDCLTGVTGHTLVLVSDPTHSGSSRLLGSFLASVMPETLNQAVHVYRNRPQFFVRYKPVEKMLDWGSGCLMLQ
jgi:hypothetical protein